MRRRRKPRTASNELRRLALAQRWDELRHVLAERLIRDPNDTEARSELERLNQGLPLRATESALTRKRREEQEMREELASELALYRHNPGMAEEWEPALLARRRKRLLLIRATLGKRLPPEQGQEFANYLAALNARWSRQRARRQRVLFFGAGIPLLALAAGCIFTASHHRANQAEESLNKALLSNDVRRVELALRAADSGVNKLVAPSLANLIHQATQWMARTQRQEAELKEELAALETGKKHISTLPLTLRAELEGNLKSLPANMQELRERWARLCEKEAQALAAQGEEILKHFATPLPPLPKLSSNPAEDEAALKKQQQLVQQRARDWEAARRVFALEGPEGEKLHERLEEIYQLRKDIAALRRTIALLPTARHYAQYVKLLGQLTPKHYPPALRMAAIHQQLPEEESLRNQMQDHGRQLPAGMLEAARKAHLDGGPSFTPAFPAQAQQVQLMEDIFTYSGLQKVLYELSAPTLPSFIVEERPEVSEQSVTFSPSPLTPGYSLDVPRRITWYNPQAVYIRRIDATPLLSHTGIARDTFFRNTNLPTLLDTLLTLEHEECPALARAYVFKRILEVMRAHEWPTMLGIAYAPTLRADARSFGALVRTLGIELEAGCWLKDNEETARAEYHCAHWFREHRHRHYAQEIARNFGALVRVHPRYVGYIGETGSPCLFRQLPQGTLLWHMAEGGLTASPLGEELDKPIMYSPVFIVDKD